MISPYFDGLLDYAMSTEISGDCAMESRYRSRTKNAGCTKKPP